MNKHAIFLLTAAAALTMSGCASMSNTRVTELNSINHSQSAHFRTYGVANMKTLGPVFVKTEDKCSLADIAKSATAKYKDVSDLVNIRMEETEIVNGSNTTYSCKSSALAVNYKIVSAEEAKMWRTLYAESTTAVAEAPAEPAAPAPQPEEPQADAVENTTAPEQPAEETETATDSFYVR